MSNEEPNVEESYRVVTRSLLIDDKIYVKGDVLTAATAGKHLLMLVRAGQIAPLDPNSRMEKRPRKKGIAKLVSRLKRMF